MKSYLGGLLDNLLDWYGKSELDGVIRLLRRQSSRGERLDCCYEGKPPSRIRNGTYSNGDLFELKFMVNSQDIEVQGLLADSGQLTLTATLGEPSEPLRPKWGCWWNSYENTSGDLWGSWDFQDSEVFLISDGLRKGQKAAEASVKAAETIEKNGEKPVAVLFELIHEKLESTRGAVMLLGRLPAGENCFQYCSVGDIKAWKIGDRTREELLSFNGTVGYNDPTIQVRSVSLEGVNHFVLHTDGVDRPRKSFFNSTFRAASPTTNAARLLSEFGREDDDALIGVIEV
ncbi:MAG: hypothetical protein ABEK50_17015 [bacterium]